MSWLGEDLDVHGVATAPEDMQTEYRMTCARSRTFLDNDDDYACVI